MFYNFYIVGRNILLSSILSSTFIYASADNHSSYEASSSSSALPQPTMRLSTQIEARDLRPFVRENSLYSAADYIRFSFKHSPSEEIGRVLVNSLVKTNRLSINGALTVPSIDNFTIIYDFWNSRHEKIGPSWECSSIDNPTGSLSILSSIDVINAVRLEAVAGGELSHGPVRFLLLGQKYGVTAPSGLASSNFGNLAPEGTLLNDPILMKQALAKCPKLIGSPAAASSSHAPQNNYTCITPLELKDSSIFIAGEYVKLAYEKYGEYPAPADADTLLSLMRAYGVVSTRTALELAEQLGLK